MWKAIAAAGVFACLALMTATNPTFAEECKTVKECAQQAVEAALDAHTEFRLAVPTGAVMAFDLPQCPPGWGDFAPLAGRVVVGAGSGNRDQADKLLTARTLDDFGGEETHVLTIDEMPKHTHQDKDYKYLMMYSGDNTLKTGDPVGKQPDLSHMGEVPYAGGDKAHNTMQPYYVLRYCVRK